MKKQKRKISILLSLIMVLTMIPSIAFADVQNQQVTEVTSVNVEVSAQGYNAFIIPHITMNVKSNEAEEYGYTDKVTNGVSAMDVLVAAHKQAFETDFTKETCQEYLVANSGYVTKIFGDSCDSTFMINNAYPHDGTQSNGYYNGLGIAQAKVKEGDIVEFAVVQDSTWCDHFTWFEKENKKIQSIAVEANQPLNLTLKGYNYAWYGALVNMTADKIVGIENAKLTNVDSQTGKMVDITNAITNENGNATASFSEAGNYILSAYTDYEDGDTAIFSPWCKVEVLPEGTIKNIEDLITAIGKVNEGSKDKIQAARNEYNKLSTEGKALVKNYDVLVSAEDTYKKIEEANSTKTITATAGANGKISPAGSMKVATDSSKTFTVRPNKGYRVSTFTVNGKSAKLTKGKYTLKNIKENYSLKVTFVANKYTIKYSGNGNGKSYKSKKVSYNSKMGTLVKPTRVGYNFKGWYTKKTGGSKITSATTMRYTGTTTIYAHWEKNAKIINCYVVEIHKKPATNTKVNGYIKKGTPVSVIGKVKTGSTYKSTWYKVKYNGKTGYVYYKYVNMI